jgi:hypothetical protein
LSPRKINQITVVLLVAGFASALTVFLTAPAAPDNELLREMQGSKKYVREMRVIGGKANQAAAEFVDWFEDLWHGRELAVTLVVLTVGTALSFRFIAAHPEYFDPDHRGEDKTPPPDTV